MLFEGKGVSLDRAGQILEGFTTPSALVLSLEKLVDAAKRGDPIQAEELTALAKQIDELSSDGQKKRLNDVLDALREHAPDTLDSHVEFVVNRDGLTDREVDFLEVLAKTASTLVNVRGLSSGGNEFDARNIVLSRILVEDFRELTHGLNELNLRLVAEDVQSDRGRALKLLVTRRAYLARFSYEMIDYEQDFGAKKNDGTKCFAVRQQVDFADRMYEVILANPDLPAELLSQFRPGGHIPDFRVIRLEEHAPALKDVNLHPLEMQFLEIMRDHGIFLDGTTISSKLGETVVRETFPELMAAQIAARDVRLRLTRDQMAETGFDKTLQGRPLAALIEATISADQVAIPALQNPAAADHARVDQQILANVRNMITASISPNLNWYVREFYRVNITHKTPSIALPIQ